MNKKIQAAVAIAVAVLAYVLVTTYPRWSAAKWQEFSSEEGRFSVLMPGVPAVKTQNLRDTQVAMHMFTADHASSSFMASYFDSGQSAVPADSLLDRARDGSIQNTQGHLISEEKITVDGYPGRAFKSVARGNNFVSSRIYLVEGRLYMLMVVHPENESSDAPKFLQSFKLLHAHV